MLMAILSLALLAVIYYQTTCFLVFFLAFQKFDYIWILVEKESPTSRIELSKVFQDQAVTV